MTNSHSSLALCVFTLASISFPLAFRLINIIPISLMEKLNDKSIIRLFIFLLRDNYPIAVMLLANLLSQNTDFHF